MSNIIASYAPEAASGISYIDNEEWSAIAQTFNMPAAFTLDQIDVKLCRLGSPGTGIVGFCPYKDGEIGGAEFSIIFNANMLTDDIDGEWKQFEFAKKSFESGTYALVLGCYTASGANRLWWAGVLGGSGYTNGKGYSYVILDDEWVDDDADYAFKLYGNMFAPPKGGPTKKRLVAVAKDTLWYEDVG